MAELRIDKPTLIAKVEGAVFVMDADGSLRRATPGMQLEPGMRLLTESDGQVELAEAGSERPEPAQPEAALPAGADAELASLQEAIRQGADPTELFAETAAGNPGAGTAGGVVGSSAGGFVVVDLNSEYTLAEAGFDTGHEARQPGDELLYAEDQDLLAAITITEPQTDDNIINADEATGVIIRGFVEDVEVGQTVTVTLIDQDGNRLTTTTVVLPGFVWEANFGDVTGKLVDGPLTIQADTQDAAGNRASDTGQTLLDTITTITLDLADESDTGTSQTDDLTRDTTPLLQGKGEPGATVTLTLEGKVMAVLTVDGNGNWQYQIPDTLADGPHDFRVDAVDIAGNRASDTLTVTVDTRAAIDIDDLDTDSILGHDKVTLSGSTTDVEAGQRVTITLVGQNGQTLFSGSALVGSDGRWQLGGLDLSSIQGPYEVRAEVTDLAGNRVIDGAPLIGQSDTLTLSEADLAKGPVSATGSLHTGAGLDGNLQVSFAADQGALNQLGLTSHGTALAYQVSGQTLTASAGGVTVFTLTLANDGSYRIVWNQSLDHGQDSLSLPFALEYRDSDGDRVSANLTVNLVDSTPPDFTIAPISLTEDDFTNPAAVVGQSQFVVGHQSDPLVATSAVFADQSATLARLNGSGISSDGHALTFEFTGDRLLTGYYLDGNGKRVEVLKAELTASQQGSDIDGNVTVSLNGPLDHQGRDQLSLGLTVSAKEIDGDETRANLVVSISDGVDPRLGIDSGVTLQEGASGQTLDGQLPVSVGSDRLVSLNFEANQPGLNGLTSGGQPTHYQVNGNVITLLDAGGKTILTVTLGLDGKYQVVLDSVLDQPVSTNSVNLGLQVQGTDFDGDKSNLGTLNIHITDGVLPQVDPVSLTLVEDSDWSAAQTLSGNLNITAGTDPLANIGFDASQPGLQGLTSGGQPVVISVSGNSISGAVNGQNVFTLTLDQNGHYVFTLNQPLDQGSADSLLKAGFTLTDSDGDKVSSTLSVAIGDGANPVISAVTGTEMTEANQGDGAVVSHMSFTVSHGADALAPDSLKFDIAAIQQSLDGKYSSHGSPVTFTLDANGELVGTSADGREVLRAELDLVESNGNWSVTAKVTLGAELDHQGSESLDLPLTVTLTDKDGDRVSTDLPLTIKDGHAPHFVAGSGVSLDERGLDGSNTLTGTGHFQIEAGSDRVSEVSFADISEQPALTALGLSVKYELVDGDASIPGNQVLKGYVEVNGQRVEVLQVELVGKLDNAASNGFDYKVTLFEGVHQSGGNATDLPFKLNIVDSDKGSGNNDSTTGTLNIRISEGDKPTLTLTGVTVSEGRFDGAGNNQTGDDQHATGTLTITADSDPVVDVRLTLSGQVVDGSGKAITHNGETLTWQEVAGSNGHSFQAVTASGTLVLTVTLPSVPGRIEAHTQATLDYQVTVHTNLDHGADDKLNLSLPVKVTDSDGSVITGSTTAVITDAADPHLGIDSGVTLQEGASGQTLDGQLPVSVGSDRLVSLNFEANQPGLNGLTSGGQPTHYQVNGNAITLLDAGGKTILTVTLGLDGKYQLALDGVLDQPVSTNSINLGLQVQGTDFDGDKSNLGTLNIHITDGVLPQVDPVSLTLVEDSDWSAAQTLTGDLAITAGADPLVNIAFDASQPGLQGLTSGGQPVVITISGNSISGAVNGQNVFTLTLDQNGHYVFTLNQPLDQGSADSLLKAGFTLTDSDGDKVSSTLSVAIGDGANPVISAVTGTEMTEANQGAKDVVSHMSFTASHGADALDTSSLKFDIAAIQQSLDGKYSSHGSPVTFTLDANGELVGTSADGREVLRAELSLVENNGNWSVTAKVTLGAELDHQGSESLDLPLTVTLTDKDGDRVSTDLPLTIKDGHAPHFVAGSGVSLDERGLDGHNTLTGTGHFQVNAGSDRVSEVSFADISEQPALTALGQSVKYELVDGDASIPGNQVLKGYVEVNGQRVEVLQVELVGKLDNAASNGFDYKVTLFEGVHQSGGSATDLPFKLNIVDSDKGSGNNDSTTGTLNIRISEGDKPTLTLTGVTLSEGRFDGAGNNQTSDDQHATGTLTITADSDPVVDVRLTLSGQVVDGSGKAITHNGETLTWQEVAGSNGHSFQAVTASGTLVLTVTLPSVPGRIEAHTQATLDYQVTVHTNLDHGADDKLNLSLPVKVTDSDGSVIIGNTTAVITDAADPHLGIDAGVSLQEGGASQSLDGQLPVNVGSDRLVSLNFEANQPGLNGLTSGGQPTHYQVSGNQITLLDAANKPILTVTLDLDGKYHVTLDGVLDQPVNTDSVNLGLQVQGTDFDGDRSNLGTLNIAITDGALPQVDPVSLTLVEDSDWSTAQTLSGNLNITAGTDPLANIGFDASQPGLQGLTSGGQPVVISVSGNSISGAVNGQNVFTLTLDQNGHYVFTLNQPLDQNAGSSLLQAGFTLTDSDGDTVPSTLSVAIGDGANPVINAVTGTSLTEANQGDAAVVGHMSFTVSHGSDALDASSLKFDIAAIQSSLHGKFSSHGSPVTFTLDASGELVGTSSDGREVLRAELSLVENNGNWSVTAKVTLGAELDHQGSESLDLPLTVTLTDKDGDRVSTQLPLTIKDGHAPHFVAGSGVSLDERHLDGHNTLTGTGHFQIEAGSDRVSEVSFADIAQQPALTALGQSVKYELVDGDASIPGNQVLKGYVEVNGHRIEVLQVELSGKLDNAASNGFDYKVTLYQGVHQSGNTATDLPFKLNIVDSDKGSGNNDSTTGTLNIRISEGDKPTLSLTGVTLSEGRFDGAGNNQTGDDQQASGTLTITADSDPVVDVRLTLSGQVLDASGKAITHNGEALTWQEVPGSNGHGFQALTASGTLVLTVTLPSVPGRIEAHTQATLDYQVKVHTNLDHGADDKLNLSLPVKVTDSDGSVITGSTTAVITDAADPVINAIGSVTVKESDLNGGSGQHVGSSPSGTGEIAIGQVTIAAGSDRVAALQLDVARFNALNTLSSGGRAVTLSAGSQPGVYLGKDSAGKLIFKLTLDVSGRYTFELTGNLDHSVQGKDLLDIQLPLQALDSDGDLSAEVIGHVSVQDDVPVAVDAGKTLNEGAKVTGDLLATASEGADDAVVRSVTINGTEHPIAASGNTSIAVTDSTGQVIGTLVISAEGNYSFTATSGVNHSNNTLVQTIDFHLVDGDGDTDDGVLTLTIRDEAGKLTVSPVTGAEDAGASDPTHGIPITMALDIGDYDRGEFVEKLLIQAPANAQGTFYFNGVALTTITQGGKTWYEVPPAAMVAVANTDDKFQLTGVTFVPNHDYSSYNNGGAALRFPVQLQVGVTEGSKPPVLTGNLDITVQGIADKPLWDAGSTHQHYTTDEDSSGIALNVKAGLTDTDGSETLSYQIKWASGQGSLSLNGKVLTPDANGIYTVKGDEINKVTVVPGKDYGGDIKLVVTPVSTEKTPVVTGQETALGDPLEVIVNVNPLADDAKLTVREIQGKEDTLIDLGSKIGLAHLGDTTDGSESLFVRISGLPAGATLLLGGVAVTQDANGYYEVPYARIGELKLQPPKDSNVDFDLTIKGVVKDSVTLTDASGQTHTVVNEKETGSQSLHVDLVGVVDAPHFDLNSTGWTQSGGGYSITIAEDGKAPLDFKLASGETTGDGSESLNLVLEGLPDDAKVFDGSGKELTLTFAGLDGKGNPLYQVDVTSLGNLQIQPPPNSTADLHLVGHVVVTENDGDHKSFDVPLTIKVEPAIDATDYAKTSHGLEDEFVVLNWQPDLSDSAEHVTHLSLSGIEQGYQIWIRVGGVETQLSVNGGALDLSDADLKSLLGGGQLLVKAPEDSDKDTHIQSHVTVTQYDVDKNPDGTPTAMDQKVIEGNLHLDIQAVVEPDGKLVQTGALDSPDGHDIALKDAFVFQDLDPSSDEVIDYLVITDLPPGFVVVGGINDGHGNWTVPNSALDSYALRAPSGYQGGTFSFNVSAMVHDLSDDGDISASVRKDLHASATFAPVSTPGQQAATVDLDNSKPIVGVEDHNVNFGSQLKQMVTLGTADADHDELSIVIKDLPQGVNVQGLTYDFVNGEYLIKLPGGLSDLDKLTLTLPEDYAGNGLSFKVRLVNTDTVSGNTKQSEKDISLSITPEVDTKGGADGQPELHLQVKDVNGQPSNLEDTHVHLDLSVTLADMTPSEANGGLETVERMTVTVDAQYGHFLDASGKPVQSLVVSDPAALKDLVFVPKQHFSGHVPLDVKVDILDTATTGTDTGSWSGNASFEVLPVNDPAQLTVKNVSGNEDGSVSLGGLGATLIDNDGSEQIVALQIKGVPDGFTLSAPAVNNGNGVWQVPVGTDFSKLTLIPPADFSGTVDLTLSAFTLDQGLTLPLETSGSFTVTVKPVGDAIIADLQDKASGTEGDVITLNLGLETRDTQATGGNAANVNENKPEQVRVTLEGVPDGAEIRLPNGVAGSVVDLGGGRWQITTDGGKLAAVELVTNDANGALDIKVTAQSLDNGALGPEVGGTIHVDVSPVNDAPINVLPSTPQVAQEDKPFVIQGLQVKDVDAGSGTMEVRLSVEHGTLNLPAGSGVTVAGNGTGSLVLTGTLADLNALLSGGVTYQGNTDFHGDDKLTMVTDDRGNTGSGGPLGDTDVLPIEVQPVNDAPVNLLPSAPQVAQEDKPFVIQGLQVKDVDAGNGIMEVRLSVEHGTLTLPAGSGVTLTGNGTGDVVLTGTLADLNALLSGGVTYQGDPDFHGNDALTMVTDDRGNTGSGGALSDTDVLPILVQPVNDAPVNQLPTTPQVAQEDQPFTIHGLQVSDVDAGNSPLSVTLSVLHGTLELAAGSGVTVSGSGSNTLVLSGSQDAINALLAGGVTYQGEQDFNGQDALTMVTNDLGNTGSGGPLSDTDVLPIEVEPVNDAPVTQVPGSLQVKEDGSLSLTGISVKDVDAGSAPISMVLRVEHGVLTLLGAAGAVSVQGAGTSVVTLVGSLDDLNGLLAGNLHYEPARDFWGQDNLSITTSDQGNTGTGGVLTDSAQIAIQVTAEPDDPQLGVGTHDILALQGAWVPLNLSASVVNPAPGELSVRIQNLGSAQVVDEHGQSVGHADGNDWLLPMDQSVPIYLKDLPAGDHALTLSAESSLGGGTLSSATETITIHSQSGHDLLGSDQGDWLFGSSGNDRLLGGMGDDVLRGGQGNDILTGGAGSDLFVWGSGDEGTTASPAIDTITDFRPQEGDRIDLADLLKGVTDNSVDGLLGHLQASVTSTGNGLSDVSLSVSPAGDGNVTQQITLKDVDLSGWNLSGSSSHDILQSMLDQHSLIIQHP
ncbi:retention module-containing protein [Aeromonas caviae]|uniref:retention module-containing protein n=9 Tax=Aeromonas caviae TaxID=648 RepID=UPI0029DD77F7|nr:retention module-containing protein [Aeromonas caviae]MDX7813717.1 retention module-containing protein [Aeromonas caviae]